MGVDPLTIGLGLAAGSSVLGAVTGDRANARNNRSAQTAQQYALQQQQLINQQAGGLMQQGQNPFSSMLLSMLNGGGAGGLGKGGFGFAQPQNVQGYTYDPTSYTGSTIGLPQNINAQQLAPGQANLNMIPQLSAQMLTPGAIGSQGFNSGQDALMQMLNRSPGPSVNDPTLGLELQQAGQSFNNSDLFGALAPLDQRLIDTQVAGLQGSLGSLGQRFGTTTLDKERQLRSDFAQNIAARNAQLQSTSFENAAQRQLQALGQRGTREQFMATLPLQQQAQQLNTAQALQQGGLQQSGLLSQLFQANQGAGLQAGQANQGATLQALLANLQAQQQTGLANQSTDLASQQANAGNWLQAMLANQGSLNQAGQFNAGAANQAGQFNAAQLGQASQFNAAQGQQYNQFISQILGQAAGLQQNQQGQNAQLLAIMAGLQGVPGVQQQPSQIPGAIGDIGQLLMFLPFLRGLQGGGAGGATPYNMGAGSVGASIRGL